MKDNPTREQLKKLIESLGWKHTQYGWICPTTYRLLDDVYLDSGFLLMDILSIIHETSADKLYADIELEDAK